MTPQMSAAAAERISKIFVLRRRRLKAYNSPLAAAKRTSKLFLLWRRRLHLSAKKPGAAAHQPLDLHLYVQSSLHKYNCWPFQYLQSVICLYYHLGSSPPHDHCYILETNNQQTICLLYKFWFCNFSWSFLNINKRNTGLVIFILQ